MRSEADARLLLSELDRAISESTDPDNNGACLVAAYVAIEWMLEQGLPERPTTGARKVLEALFWRAYLRKVPPN